MARPKDAWPAAPAGFQVELYADGLANPRLVRTAPNGDLFVAESEAGEVRVFRGAGAGRTRRAERTVRRGLEQPFGIAFYPPGDDPQWVYVANTDSVVRFPYRSGDLQARGAAETVVADLPGGGRLCAAAATGRGISAFSRDGKKLYVSVGLALERRRHRRQRRRVSPGRHAGRSTPTGKNLRVFAWGIRNAVGIAVHPQSGELWASVNERDLLGDNLVPDYITHVEPGGFYGWPWYYIGGHQDPRHAGKHPELAAKVIVPDVLLQPHDASLEMISTTARSFPPSTAATSSPPSTARGTGRCAAATR